MYLKLLKQKVYIEMKLKYDQDFAQKIGKKDAVWCDLV